MDDFITFDLNGFSPLTSFPQESFEEPEDFFEESGEKDKKIFKCTFPDCGKIFRFKSAIIRHQCVHANNRPYPCPEDGCNKAFKRADALENHMRIHSKETPFICTQPDCNLQFPTKAALRYHLLKHEGQRAYRCSYEGCGRTFITQAQLKQHENASTYHKKIRVDKPETPVIHMERTVDDIKDDLKKTKRPQIEIALPEPRVMKKIKWETKNPVEMDTFSNEVNMQDFQQMAATILRENAMLKEKLDQCTRFMSMNNYQQGGFEQAYPPNYYAEKKPMSPQHFGRDAFEFNHDESEFSLLNFLKEKEMAKF